MKRIIATKSSEISVEIGNQDVKDCLINLQIILRIERLLGSKLPGSQFEAVELTCRFYNRRKICKRARKTNTWVRFIMEDERKYLLLTPSGEIINEEVKPLTKEEILSCLAEMGNHNCC